MSAPDLQTIWPDIERYVRAICEPLHPGLGAPGAVRVALRPECEVAIGAPPELVAVLIGQHGRTATAIRCLVVGFARARGYRDNLSVRVADPRGPA